MENKNGLSRMNQWMWKIILKLQESAAGRGFVAALHASGLIKLWHYMVYKQEQKHPTQEMNESALFLKANKERILYVRDMLADKRSKDTFMGCLKFRATHDFKDRPDYNPKTQYFPTDIITLDTDEVFIDCGAYNGDTIREFCKRSQGRYKRIVAFEPDESNIRCIRTNFRDIVVIEAAVWSENTELYFEAGKGSESVVNTGGTIAIQARTIDSVEQCHDVTFIKMDIEGSEYNALLGAEQTIRANHPKLAICIYHSDEDMLRLIELVHGWQLGYRFYVRHHGQKTPETVMYAIPSAEAC